MEKKKSQDKSYKVLVGILSVLCVLLLIASVVLVVKTVKIKRDPQDSTDTNISASQSGNNQGQTEPYKVSTATVGSAGDILIHNPVLYAAYSSSTKEYDFNNIFTYAKKTISDCDYFIANLEVSLGGPDKKFSGYPLFNCPDSIVDAAGKAGIDCFLTANNHCYDTNTTGFTRTQEIVSQKGYDHIGSRLNETDKKYLVKDINGISFGFICYTYETPSQQPNRKALNGILMTEKDSGLINSFNYDKLQEFYTDIEGELEKMKADGAEVLTVYLHWGDEYHLNENSYQEEMAQKLCDMGVDVIIGGHPHVVEPIELLRSTDGSHKTICVYSVGNFVSNQRREYMNLNTGHTEDGLIFTMTFSKYSDGEVKIEDIEAIPIWVHLHNENGVKVYSIVPLDGNLDTDASSLGLNKSGNGVSQAKSSYERTVKVLGDGYGECQKYVDGTLKEEAPEADTSDLNTDSQDLPLAA